MAGRTSLRKASTSIFRSPSVDGHARQTFCRSLSNAVDHSFQTAGLQQPAEDLKTIEPSNWGNYLRWSSGVAVAAGLAWLQFRDPRGNDAQCYSDAASVESELSSAASMERQKPKLFLKDSYRRRIFFNYERRIRLRSSPEKVFEYFASIRNSEGELLMTPADLMRAVIPVFPPSESNIIREGYLKSERPPGELRCYPSEFFMLFDTNRDGYISFPEYIFFMTLLSIPESHFSAAFKMFDLDQNGEIDREEFKSVMGFMRDNTRQGGAQRDGLRTGLKVVNFVENGGLVEFFFGKDGKGQLHLGNFEQFLRNLHKEIVRLEFLHYDYQSCGTISAKDFALSMVAAADLSRINQYLDRVDEINNDPAVRNIRITSEEFQSFAELRKKLQPLALAMSSYGKVNGLLTKTDFQRAASQVCDVSITDNVVDIVFCIFDLNRDGNLSTHEFLGVLERRERDIGCPRESGIIYLLTCWLNCAKKCWSPWIC